MLYRFWIGGRGIWNENVPKAEYVAPPLLALTFTHKVSSILHSYEWDTNSVAFNTAILNFVSDDADDKVEDRAGNPQCAFARLLRRADEFEIFVAGCGNAQKKYFFCETPLLP